MDITSVRRRSCHCADAGGKQQGKNRDTCTLSLRPAVARVARSRDRATTEGRYVAGTTGLEANSRERWPGGGSNARDYRDWFWDWYKWPRGQMGESGGGGRKAFLPITPKEAIGGEPKARECHALFHPDTPSANCDSWHDGPNFPREVLPNSAAPFGGEGCLPGWRPAIRAGAGSGDPRTAESVHEWRLF